MERGIYEEAYTPLLENKGLQFYKPICVLRHKLRIVN